MAMRHLDKTQCQPYFADVSRALGAHTAEVDINGLGLRMPTTRDWTPLRDVTYDPAKDTFQIVTADLDHLIPHPQELLVETGADGLHAIEVVDADGNPRHIRLRSPLPLTDR